MESEHLFKVNTLLETVGVGGEANSILSISLLIIIVLCFEHTTRS